MELTVPVSGSENESFSTTDDQTEEADAQAPAALTLHCHAWVEGVDNGENTTQ
jgi:hypothetical protein